MKKPNKTRTRKTTKCVLYHSTEWYILIADGYIYIEDMKLGGLKFEVLTKTEMLGD